MRPTIIDLADGACEICKKHQPFFCDRCGTKIKNYREMNGSGFQSVIPTHFHITSVSGYEGKEAKYAELCYRCYVLDFATQYPEVTVPEEPAVNE